MVDPGGIYEELRNLSRGRGVPGSDLAASLGSWIPGDSAKIEAELRAAAEALPPDLRLVALGVLGLHPEIRERFLAGRLTLLAGLLGRDDRTVRRRMDEAFRLLTAELLPPPPPVLVSSSVTLTVSPIELLSGVDALVATGNIYLEAAQTYKSSVSAVLRRSVAEKGPAGEIVDDVMARGLAEWTAAHGRPGLPVASGTVVPLPPGALRSRGIRRLYYAALAVAHPGTNDYEIAPETVAHTVSGVFTAAREDALAPPIRSIALPVLGAGRCGLPVATSVRWIRTALERELSVDGPWRVHVVTHRTEYAPVIAEALSGLPAFR
jgi:O-acetyl-ADP-ribose deacetylase (regulator of RNase III)